MCSERKENKAENMHNKTEKTEKKTKKLVQLRPVLRVPDSWTIFGYFIHTDERRVRKNSGKQRPLAEAGSTEPKQPRRAALTDRTRSCDSGDNG